jgi:glycosyltransferase involved in cell wall biosynthesis
LRLALDARKRAMEKFDWEVVAEKYTELYDRLIRVGGLE